MAFKDRLTIFLKKKLPILLLRDKSAINVSIKKVHDFFNFF